MVRVRWAAEEDALVVRRLLRANMRFEGERSISAATFRRVWAASRRRKDFRFALAIVGGRAVGLASLHEHYSTYRGRPLVRVEDVIVEASMRGQGVGQALMTFATRRARAIGAVRLELSVAEWNRKARRFYAANGFEGTPYLRLDRPLP